MKICAVSTDFLPNIGGIAQHIVELCSALRDLGHEVHVVAPDEQTAWSHLHGPVRETSEAGLRVWRVPCVMNRSVPWLTGTISARLSNRRFGDALVDLCARLRPDVLHWHSLERGYSSVGGLPLPRVWTNHSSQFLSSLIGGRGRIKFMAQAEAAHAIIVVSEELREATVRHMRVPPDRVVFLSNGVDVKRFRPDVDPRPWPERLARASGEQWVLCPRRLERKNGVRYYVEAALQLLGKGLGNTRFLIAGDFTGPQHLSDEPAIRRMLAAHPAGRHVVLLGRVENADMPALYAASDLIVLPSLVEATSLAALEGMATGKPVIATNVGGLPHLVHHESTGLLVPPEDPMTLAHAMAGLLADPARGRRLGASGRARAVAHFSWEAVARATCDVYEMARLRAAPPT
jgi:glycosyltransferase involved in cell wall biosynthesis